MIANFVSFKVRPSKMDDFIQIGLENSRGSINGPGCLATSIFRDPYHDDMAYVFEVFADQSAFDYHHDQPYFKEWEKKMKELTVGPPHHLLLQNTAYPDPNSFALLRASVAGEFNS